MPLSATGAITVAIGVALCVVIIAAAVHRTVTNRDKPFDENGVPKPAGWVPNQYPPEQLKRLDEVRWLARRELWVVANDVRQSRGMGTPDWHPGDNWVYGPERATTTTTTTSGLSANAIARNIALLRYHNQEALEQDVVNNLANIEHVYRTMPYLADDSLESNEDDYGMPVVRNTRPPAQAGFPDMLRRWTQHGAPRDSQQQFNNAYEMPRIMLNDQDFDVTDENRYLEMQRPIEPETFPRTSSVYSARTLDRIPRVPSSTDMVTPESTASTTRTPQKPRVHDIIARWETANGACS